VTSGGSNFNEFPENQPSKFRVFYIESHSMDASDRHKGQIGGSVCPLDGI